MTCCGAGACESQFDRKRAARELKDYRAHGPQPTTRAMIHLLRRAGVDGSTLLDIGGGIGAIQYDLLEAGAREVTAVDASSAYQQAALRDTRSPGGRGRYRHARSRGLLLSGDGAAGAAVRRVLPPAVWRGGKGEEGTGDSGSGCRTLFQFREK